MEAAGMGTKTPNNEQPKSKKQHPVRETPCGIRIVPNRFGGFKKK